MSFVIPSCGDCAQCDDEASSACVPGVLCDGETGPAGTYYYALGTVQAAGGVIVAEMADGKCYTFDEANAEDPCPGTPTTGTTYDDCRICRSGGALDADCCDGTPGACSPPLGVPASQILTVDATLQGRRACNQISNPGSHPLWFKRFQYTKEETLTACAYPERVAGWGNTLSGTYNVGTFPTTRCNGTAITPSGIALVSGGNAANNARQDISFSLNPGVLGEPSLVARVAFNPYAPHNTIVRAAWQFSLSSVSYSVTSSSATISANHDACGNGTVSVSGSISGTQTPPATNNTPYVIDFTFSITLEEVGLYPCVTPTRLAAPRRVPTSIQTPTRRVVQANGQPYDPERDRIVEAMHRGGGCRGCGDGSQ